MKNILILAALMLIAGCCRNPFEIDTDQARSDILLAEKEFARMAADSGITEAFIFFADKDAAVLRGEKKSCREKTVSASILEAGILMGFPSNGPLTLSMSRLRVTSAILMAGMFIRWQTAQDRRYPLREFFHTVWKKQPDGSWKFVWD